MARTDPHGATTGFERDGHGRVVAQTDPLGGISRAGWRPDGRPDWFSGPGGERQEWTYHSDGSLAEHRGVTGAVTAYDYGPFGKEAARTEPDGSRYVFTYDTELRLTAVANPAGSTWRYRFDPVGNLVGETDFNGRAVAYRHDALGNLVEQVNGAGESISYERDVFGRITRRTAADVEYEYSYSTAGQLTSAVGAGTTLEIRRDAMGRILSESVDGFTSTYEYDALGRTTRRTTPTGAVSEWTYDAAGLPLSLTTSGGGISFRRDPAGRETERFFGAAAAMTQAFDPSGRLTGQAVWAYDQPDPAAPRMVHHRGYSYLADGTPAEITDSLRGSRRFETDALGRVTAVHAATWTERYAYDALGNLTRAHTTSEDGGREGDGDGGSAGDRELSGTLTRRAGRTTYRHDAQGRVVLRAVRTLSGQPREWAYTWDADDQLTEVTTPDGHTWSYRYDPLGRRIAKLRLAVDGTITEQTGFSWDGTRLAERREATAGGRVRATTWDWEPASHRVAAQNVRSWAADAPQELIDESFFAIVTDLAGTPTELVRPDGQIAWHATTDVWGAPIRAAGVGSDTGAAVAEFPLRFAGQYHDAETGLNHNYYRYYDPAIGAYTGPDPLGLAPAFNHHAYVLNPLVWSDPLGLAGITPARYKHLDRPDFQNYLLRDSTGNVYYSGMFGPGETAADVRYRHSQNHDRFDPNNGDTLEVQPGTRTYGEARIKEQALCDQYGSYIGRDPNTHRGNRQQPLDGAKKAEYQAYMDKKAKQSGGCP